MYELLRQVYMRAVRDTYILPLVVTGLAFFTTFAIENKNIKKVEEERKVLSEETRVNGKENRGTSESTTDIACVA